MDAYNARLWRLFYFTGGFMAQYDGSIRINTQIDTNGIRRGESAVRGSLNRISEAARSTAALLASVFAIKKLIQFGKEAIELGSDLEEVQNVVDVTFTTMSEKVNEFSKNAAMSAGLSEAMAKRYVGTFGAMSKSFGFAEDEAYQMSTALTQLSGDVASFYNITQDEAYTKLKSVFTGETETLKDLGVVMTQAALDQYALANGFGKTTSKMTEQEKVALRYRFVMDRLAGASGDFIRTSDSWANQTRILKLQIESLKATIGQGLINVLTPVLKMINILISKLAVLANSFKSFTELITGKKSTSVSGTAAASGISDSVDGYNEASDAADNLANSTEKVADATKNAKKAAEGYLSPLDEINKFSKNEELADLEQPEAGIDIGDIGEIENIDYGKVAEGENVLDKVSESANGLIGKLKELAGIFKQGFFDGLGDWEYRWESIKESISSIKDSLIDIWTDPSVLAAADKYAQSVVYLLGSIAGSMASIGLTIAANILGGIAQYLEGNKDRIKEYLISMFDIWSEVNYLLSELFQGIAYVFEAFASENGQRLTANLIGIFSIAFMGITEILSKLALDVLNVFIQPFVDNKEKFRTALEGLLGVLADVAGTIKEGIDETFAKLNEVYDDHIKPFFESLAQGLSDIVGKILDFWNGSVQPFLDQAAKDFDALWKEHIQPLLNNLADLIGKVADLLKALWENVLQPFITWVIENVLPKILPVIQKIWDTIVDFVSYIADAIDGIITIFGGIIDFLTGAFTGDWEKAVSGLEEIAQGLVDAFSALVEGVKTIGADIINGLLEGCQEILSGIGDWIRKNIFDPFINAFKNLFGIHSPSTVMQQMGVYLMQGLLNGIKSLVNNIKEIWNMMKEQVLEIWKNIKENLSQVIDSIKQNISQKLSNIKSSWSNAWNGMKNAIGSIMNSIKSVVQDTFGWISRQVENIKDKLDSVSRKSSITGTAASRFLSVAGASKYGRSASPLAYPAPALEALQNTPIPRLATGAVIPANREFLAVLGDQKHGTNVEAPLDTIRQASEEAVLNVLSKFGMSGGKIGGTPVNLTLQVVLDKKVLGQSMVDWGKLQQMATGSNPYGL